MTKDTNSLDLERTTSTSYKRSILTKSSNCAVMAYYGLSMDFTTAAKITAVFGIIDSLKVFVHHSQTQNALLCAKTLCLSQ